MLLLKSRIIIISSFKEHINTFISFSQRKKLVNIKKCVKHIEFVYTAAEEQSTTKKNSNTTLADFFLLGFLCVPNLQCIFGLFLVIYLTILICIAL